MAQYIDGDKNRIINFLGDSHARLIIKDEGGFACYEGTFDGENFKGGKEGRLINKKAAWDWLHGTRLELKK